MPIESIDSIEVTLAAGETLSTNNTSPEIDSMYADKVQIHIGDGLGNDPATHDLDVDRYSEEFDDWMGFLTATSATQSRYVEEAAPHRVRVDLTNSSGAQATFRLEIQATTVGRR